MASHSVENGAQGFKCEHCSANFTTKSVLSVHLREAHGDKLVTKKEAQKAANASDKNLSNGPENLQQMIMKGPKVSRGFPQRYRNLFCIEFLFIMYHINSTFNTYFPTRIAVGRGNVTRHIRGSFGGVVFRNKSFPLSPVRSLNSQPSTHSTTPNNKLPAKSANGWSRCHICNKKFLTPANLKQHMLLHQGGKPFRCNFCGLR